MLVGYPPHPYFGGKFLVFLSLRTVLRRKVLIIKKFPAKYSRKRSYGRLWPDLAASGRRAARREDEWDEGIWE
jgi:hypothetical protein